MAPPAGITFPDRRFIVTRLDAGVETTVITSTPLPNNYTSDQATRVTTFDSAKAAKLAEPNVVYLIYSPCSGAYWTDRDRIWDSRTMGLP